MKVRSGAFLLVCCSSLTATALAQTKVASLPSPRGLAYHRAILAQTVRATGRFPIRRQFSPPPKPVNLWIVPAHDGQPVRGLGWDGVAYDVQRVGAPADWRADVKAAFKPRVEGEPYILPAPYEFASTPLTISWLRQLNAPDLLKRAELDLKDHRWGRGQNASDEYVLNLRDAALGAFISGDWRQSKRQCQTLLAFLPPKPPRGIYNGREEAQEVLADVERRLHPAPRPKEEVAALIYDLQNVSAFQMSSPGDIDWSQSPTVRKLIDLGDAAIPRLLDALEKDDRLTLSVRINRANFRRVGSVGTVRDAVLEALQLSLHHSYYGPNSGRLTAKQRFVAIADQIRTEWSASKGQSPVERVFQTLADPASSHERLVEAAQQLIQIGPAYNRTFIQLADGTLQPATANQTFFGEPLRARSSPSVSDVLEARIKELDARAVDGQQPAGAININSAGSDGREPYELNNTMRTANTLAYLEAKWDPERGAALLGGQLELAKRYASTLPSPIAENGQRNLQNARRQFLAARLKTPFRAEALGEYATYLQSVPFGRLPKEDYSVIWRFPAEPSIQHAVQALFDAPKKPFQEAAQWKTGSFEYDGAFRLLHSPLLKNPVFKAAVLRELDNKTVIGSVRVTKPKEAELRVSAWDWSGQSVELSNPTLEQGKSQPLRVCDLVGFWLYRDVTPKNQMTRYESLVDVSLPTAQRDAQLARATEFVKANREVSDDLGFTSFDY